MRCPYCGEDNPDDAIVCEHCGKALKRSNRAYIEKMREEEAKDDEAFFESDMYGSSEYNDDDTLTEPVYDADIADDTENASANTQDQTADDFSSDEEDEVEKQAAHGFSFDEGEDDDAYEELLEPEESKAQVVWGRLKNYVLEGKEDKKQTQRRKAEYEEEEAEKTRVFTPKDEEATRIYNPHDYEENQTFADERDDYYEEKPKHHAFPFKGIVIVLAVVLVVGLVFYTKNRSSSNGSLNKSSTTTTVSSNPQIASVKASSSTTSTTSNTYTPDMMIDGDTTTAWNVRKPYNGLGATATFTLQTRSKVKACKIMNGYDKSQLIYYRNNRIKSCTFTFDDGSETVTLKDLYNQYQTVTFSKTHTTKTVKIKINTIYHGTRYIDCAVSEISFS